MILTPYEKREFASATYLYWEAKAEAVEIGRIKFAKKTKKMDLDDPTVPVAAKISLLRNSASAERAQNLLFTERGRVAGPWNLAYSRGTFFMDFQNQTIPNWYSTLNCLMGCIGQYARANEDFLFTGTMRKQVYENNILMTREDLQSFIRKANNSAVFASRVQSALEVLGASSRFYSASRLTIPNLTMANYSLEAIQTTTATFTTWDGTVILALPGKTLELPTGARDLSQIIPRRI